MTTGAILGTAAPAGGGPGGGRVLDFRRRGAPPRRRRPSVLLSLARPLAAALVLVAVPSGVVAWVLTAPRFELRDVVVAESLGTGGTHRVSAAWVRQTLAPLQGKNLVLLPLGRVAGRLHRNPWIASVELVKELPDRLRVRVSERHPEALLLSGGSLVYTDEDGRSIAPVASAAEREAARRARLVVVSFTREPHPDGVAAALKVAGELGRVQPDWAGHLARIEVLGEEDFRLHSEALPFPLLVTRGRVGENARRLRELLPELQRRYSAITVVDLRFSRRIVVQPAQPALPPGPRAAGEGA